MSQSVMSQALQTRDKVGQITALYLSVLCTAITHYKQWLLKALRLGSGNDMIHFRGGC